jgi:NADH-quinone oxidoreductase subunit E
MARVLSQKTLDEIEQLTKRYPTRLAALLPALHLVQYAHGHISRDAELDVAEKLDVPPTRVREVVTFYTMYHDEPVGRNVVKICRNLACQLRGADRIMDRAKEVLGIEFGETTPDGRITLEQDECLASCGTGPMLWCNDQIVENLDEKKLEAFLAGLR